MDRWLFVSMFYISSVLIISTHPRSPRICKFIWDSPYIGLYQSPNPRFSSIVHVGFFFFFEIIHSSSNEHFRLQWSSLLKLFLFLAKGGKPKREGESSLALSHQCLQCDVFFFAFLLQLMMIIRSGRLVVFFLYLYLSLYLLFGNLSHS